jgi:lipopolysaccharide/colanic/teichoic acid biosynthesis glycosyltransferase
MTEPPGGARRGVADVLIVPCAFWATVVAAIAQYVAAGQLTPAWWTVLLGFWMLALGLRRFLRGRTLKSLLKYDFYPPPPMKRMDMERFGVHPERRAEPPEGGPYVSPELEARIEKGLRSRRLVLLSGDRLSGRTRTAYDVLQNHFSRHKLLVPSVDPSTPGPPLAELLTCRRFSRRRKYALWLGDMEPHLRAGLDPRIIERWLAIGNDGCRVAIGTITPTDLQRVHEGGASAREALERADQVPVGSAAQRSGMRAITSRVEEAKRTRPCALAVMRTVAAWRILGITGAPDAELVLEIATRALGKTCTEKDLEWACAGAPACVLRDGRRTIVEPHPQLVQVVDEAEGGLDPRLLEAFFELRPEAVNLLAMGHALTHRGQLDEAQHALERAEAAARPDQLPAIATALVNLAEIRGGASGARLLNRGGLDFNEKTGPAQRAALRRLFPAGIPEDDVFDPSFPPDEESAYSRFYRLTLRRAVVRVIALILMDAVALAVASFAALGIRAWARGDEWRVFDPDLGKLLVLAIPTGIAAAAWLGLYRADAARARLPQILATMTTVAILVATGFVVADADVGSVGALGTLLGVSLLVDWGLRGGYDWVSRRWVRKHRFESRLLLLGLPRDARRWASHLRTSPGKPVQPVAFLSPESSDDPFAVNDRSDFEISDAAPRYPSLEDRLADLHIADVVIVDRALTTAQKADLITRTHRFGVDVRYVANDDEIIIGAAGKIGETSLVHAPAALLSPEALELKRLIDMVLVTLLLPVWAAIIVGYAVYSSIHRPGQPIVVSVDRVGLGGIGFSMFRLRTRTVHPDGTRGTRETGRVEALFERFGFDEAPQAVNVLRGEMSVVGPRPLRAIDVEQLSRDQRRTLSVRPGITGRWQLESPPDASEADMRAMDADYLRRWRVVHDIALVIRTSTAIFGRGYLNDTTLAKGREAVERRQS